MNLITKGMIMVKTLKEFLLLLLSTLLLTVPLQAQGKLAKDARIAVIGAGASGLTAAHTLREKGYTDITVYEKDLRVGGKVYSVAEAGQTFEVGAFWAGEGYAVVDELAKTYQVDFQKEELAFKVRLEDGREYELTEYLQKTYKPWELAAGFYHWQKVQKKFAYLKQADGFFQSDDPDLALPFADFIKKYKIEAFAQGFRPFWIGCGYGYYEETPAIYVLKLMLGSLDIGIGDFLKAILPFGGGRGSGLRRAPEGYQQVWVRLAQDLGNVRVGSEVTHVTRRQTTTGYEIDITAQGQTETYDALIVSTDPKTALNFLDATPEETDLFSQVRSYPYVIHLFEATGLPYKDGTMVFLDAYGTADTKGHVTAFVNRPRARHVWTSGQIMTWDMSLDESTDLLRQDLADLGGQVGEIYQRVQWNYFPYADSQALHNGFYRKLKALQGVKNTWYVGGLLNFETVESTAAYAKKLVNTSF
jgi:hypothetical protein